MISIAWATGAALAPATTPPARAAAQEWDPKYYMKTAGFVPELGRPVMDALPPPPARVLDVGCGEGTMALELMAQGYDMKGVDLDGSMVARARERGVEQPERRSTARSPIKKVAGRQISGNSEGFRPATFFL